MQNLRENLSADMKQFLVDTKWDNHVKEVTQDILEFRTDRPLLYLYEKFTVKQKIFNNNKISLMIFDLAISVSKLNPAIHAKDFIISAILKIMIDRYQFIRIKKFEAFKCAMLLLIECPGTKESKELVIKCFNDKIDENTSSNQFSRMIYVIILYVKLMQEVQNLIDSMEIMGKKKLSLQELIWFIQEDQDQELSLMAQLNLIKVLQGDFGKIKQEDQINIQNITFQTMTMLINDYFQN